MPRTNFHVQEYCMQNPRNHFFSSSRPRSVLILLAAGLALCILVMPALANAPSSVVVDIQKDTGQMTVTIVHPSADPKTHYIQNVKVKLNERVVIDNDYKSQPTADTFSYTYPIQVSAGDTVRVTATCVLGGSETSVVTLPTPSSTAPPTIVQTTMPLPPTTQKSPAGIISLLGLGFCAVIALVLNRK